MALLDTRLWRSRRALASGALRAALRIGGVESSEGTLARTLRDSRASGNLSFARDWSFAQLLEWAAKRYKHRPFVEYGNQRISFLEMNRRANRVARSLERAGLRTGEGVALMMGNHPRFLEVFFATQKLGAYCVPINAGLIGEGLAYILGHSEVKIAVLDHTTVGAVGELAGQLQGLERIYVSSDEAGAGFCVPDGMRGYVELEAGMVDDGDNLGRWPDPQAPCLLLYTSGTTGLPKAVVTTFGNTRVKAMGLLANAQYNAGDKLYTCLPLFHANALLLTVMQALWVGIPVYIGKRFSASRFWGEVADSQATAFNTVGSMIPILLKTPPSPDDRRHRVKRVLSAACPKDAWEPFEERFGLDIWEAYGAVDGAGVAIANLGNCPVGSLGKMPARGKLVDDQGNEVATGEAGELIVFVGRGRESGVQYFKNEAASSDKVRDGWLHTGDTMLVDDAGYLYFVGRNTDSMRRRGENVSAYEVEKQVDAHPDVLESAAFGVPSELGEEDIMVVVVPIEGRSIDAAGLLDFLRARLPKYALPAYMEVVEEIPKTGTHRVIKTELKARGVTAKTVKL
ncbi:MAG: AMP-binding protein [Myxococcales bacterium]|nr:AMP-binding protein [Myxococcales bacterium]